MYDQATLISDVIALFTANGGAIVAVALLLASARFVINLFMSGLKMLTGEIR